ncbi:hypothetical protein Tsubulata_002211 [Turnera subulata]|uniref:MATH domain-containing protein n=1 Tax=Turnera subulata TaxID=218843 RepID=A0A9Q0F887_9ROSI|nr:hypothetical protein Tsubulata_002211 [Turnera subulata]
MFLVQHRCSKLSARLLEDRKLSLHPGKKADVGCHVSLSLAIEEPSNKTPTWEVNVNVKFFMLDQIRGQYLIIPDAFGQERRFDWTKLAWCFPNLIAHDVLNDPSKGYLVNDFCVFGVEVFVQGNTRRGETLSWVKQSKTLLRNCNGGGQFCWNIDNFSTIDSEYLCSPVFTAGGQQWKLRLYPKGEGRSDGKHLSIFLDLENIPPGKKVFAHYRLRLKDQIGTKHLDDTDEVWFDAFSYGWGFGEFILVSEVQKEANGFLVNDSIIIEAQLNLVSAEENVS